MRRFLDWCGAIVWGVIAVASTGVVAGLVWIEWSRLNLWLLSGLLLPALLAVAALRAARNYYRSARGIAAAGAAAPMPPAAPAYRPRWIVRAFASLVMTALWLTSCVGGGLLTMDAMAEIAKTDYPSAAEVSPRFPVVLAMGGERPPENRFVVVSWGQLQSFRKKNPAASVRLPSGDTSVTYPDTRWAKFSARELPGSGQQVDVQWYADSPLVWWEKARYEVRGEVVTPRHYQVATVIVPTIASIVIAGVAYVLFGFAFRRLAARRAPGTSTRGLPPADALALLLAPPPKE